jgi:hypothetical protein
VETTVTAPRLPQVEALVERLASDIANKDPQTESAWLIEGVATAGKSTALRMLADGLRDQGQVAIMAAPAAHSLDAGPMALAELAGGLKDAGCVNGQTEILRDGTVPLAEKIKRVRQWIINSSDSVVLLLDEPSAWPDRFEQTQHFADHARLVVQELVRDIPCRRVLTGGAPEGMSFRVREPVGASSEPQAFLTDSDVWGELAQSAGYLLEGAGGQLGELSPLQLRLVVALAYVTSVDEARDVLALGTRSRRALSRRLLEALKDHGGYKDLLRAWRRLAHIRRPLAEGLIGSEITGKLSKRSLALLRNCLLYEVDGSYLLHETLREDARAIDPKSEREDYEQFAQLCRYYRGLRNAAEKRDCGCLRLSTASTTRLVPGTPISWIAILISSTSSTFWARRSPMSSIVTRRRLRFSIGRSGWTAAMIMPITTLPTTWIASDANLSAWRTTTAERLSSTQHIRGGGRG